MYLLFRPLKLVFTGKRQSSFLVFYSSYITNGKKDEKVQKIEKIQQQIPVFRCYEAVINDQPKFTIYQLLSNTGRPFLCFFLCFYIEKDDFDQPASCEALLSKSKYTA